MQLLLYLGLLAILASFIAADSTPESQQLPVLDLQDLMNSLPQNADKDADGLISMQEFQQYFQTFITQQELENWNDSKHDQYLWYDANGDGVVTVQELSLVLEGLQDFELQVEPDEYLTQQKLRSQWWLRGSMTVEDYSPQDIQISFQEQSEISVQNEEYPQQSEQLQQL